MSDDLLYKLALRLSTHAHEGQPKLLVGSLPESLPVPVPLPAGAQLLGSLIEGQDALRIVLDVPGPQKEVRAAYEQQLAAAGWHELEGGPAGHGGFIHSFATGFDYRTYTHNEGWALVGRWSDEGQAVTGIQLHLRRDLLPLRGRRPGRYHENLFPALLPPEGAQQQGGGGGASDTMVHTNASVGLQEEWMPPRLAAHYTEQLRQAAWTPLAQETTEHSAWSTWSFRDQDGNEWLAAFYLFRLPGEALRYELSLRADVKNTRPASGWFSFSSGTSQVGL